MYCGDVIFREDKPYVITEIVNGTITKTENLEDYVAKNLFIEYKGQHRSLFGVLHDHMAEYLYYNDIVKDQNEKEQV